MKIYESNQDVTPQNKPVIFQSKGIGHLWYENEWHYSVVDIVEVLTDSKKPRDYWYRVKKRASEEEKIELSTICRQLKLESSDGKIYATDCADTKIWVNKILCHTYPHFKYLNYLQLNQ